MRYLALAVGAAAVIGLAHNASAADLGGNYKSDNYVAPRLSWTGFYLGAGGGGGFADADTSLYKKDWGVYNAEEYYAASNNGSGGFGTVQIGADYQFGASPFVLGAFADFDFTGVSSDVTLLSVQQGRHYPGTLDYDNVWSAGGRAGFLATPNVLLYGLIGYTHAEATLDSVHWAESKDLSFDGVTFGGGVDFRVSGNWFLKLEYRYAQYGSEKYHSYFYTYSDEPGGNSGRYDIETSMHTGRAVLSYKFGAGSAAEGLK